MNSINSLKRHDGELMIDNRASGLSIPSMPGMGSFVEVRTIGCIHCGGAWIENPLRQRPREYCRHCNRYMCDNCAAVAKEPDYIHRTIDDIRELVQSGNWTIAGGTASKPILVPTNLSPSFSSISSE
jgi:hypothetical protein